MKKKKQKVFVGLSGGVDSSVSAALLQKAGYDVTGVFIKVWQPDFFECTWRQDRLDAMRVCAKLGIPFVTLNLEDTYKKEVVDYMIAEYKAGRTPNPDVMCNKYVKFGGFFDWAMGQGADFIATGHYAQTKKIDEKTALLKSVDDAKDQTYFLWTLTQEQLSKVLFPVGNFEKPTVRTFAKRFKLLNAEKKDSQGLCFIGKIDIKDFLHTYIEEKKGFVLNKDGQIIGEHDGVFYLTIGQRHGFTILKKTPEDEPYYIIGKDIEKNTITVAQDRMRIVHESSHTVLLEKVHWMFSTKPDFQKVYQARLRYRSTLAPCTLHQTERGIELNFKEPQRAITSGQSAVIYDGEVVLGGGIII